MLNNMDGWKWLDDVFDPPRVHIMKITGILYRKDVEENTINNCLWYNLPIELLIKIFRYLPHSDLLQVRLVCKLWRDLTYLPEFMEKSKLIINRYNLANLYDACRSDATLPQRMAYQSLEIQALDLSDDLKLILKSLGSTIRKVYLIKSPAFAILNECVPDLEELVIKKIYITEMDNKFSLDLSKFNNLKSLDVRYGLRISSCISNNMRTLKMEKLCLNLDEDTEELVLDTVQFHSESLKYLEIALRYEPVMIAKWKQVFAMLKNLKVLIISGSAPNPFVKQIMMWLPEETPLENCDLSGCLQIDDELLKFIIHKWPKSLAKLDLMFSKCITDEAIKDLGILRDSLHTLNLGNCSRVTLKGLLEGIAAETNNTLKDLNLNYMSYQDPLSVCALAKRLPNLTHLSLAHCENLICDIGLSVIFRHQSLLQHLILNDCTNITDDAFLGFGHNPAPITNLKGLQTLNIHGCRKITNLTLMYGLKFNELRTLMLGYSNGITAKGVLALVENCPALENLTISSCPMVNDDAMHHIGHGLPRLRELHTCNCFSITNKSINYIVEKCQSLRHISMYGTFNDIKELHEKFVEIKHKFLELNSKVKLQYNIFVRHWWDR